MSDRRLKWSDETLHLTWVVGFNFGVIVGGLIVAAAIWSK